MIDFNAKILNPSIQILKLSYATKHLACIADRTNIRLGVVSYSALAYFQKLTTNKGHKQFETSITYNFSCNYS